MSFSFVGTKAALAAASVIVLAGAAHGAFIQHGTYQLHNHPDGAVRPPSYGLRLDELYDVTSGHDNFTFDFDAPGSAMFMDVTATTIRIYGVSFGGRDTGSSYANDIYRGFYEIDFLYYIGVHVAVPDDDIVVDLPDGSQYNYGTLLAPNGDLFSLRDGHYTGDQRDFRLGDGDNDLGHRGHPGISGWGWLFHTPVGSPDRPYVASSDWPFTATIVDVPAPGAAGLAIVGAAALAGRRRRN